MVKVERKKFKIWTTGLLLDRDSSGVCKVYDGEDCEEAQEALDRGETIQLTSFGKVISEMSVVDGIYQERLPEKKASIEERNHEDG